MKEVKYLNSKGQKFTRAEIEKTAKGMDCYTELFTDKIIIRNNKRGKFISEFKREK